MMERAWKPNVEITPNCPRCGSSNTKFCYYNNYSLTQPRYFCKGCRRYWTKGGSLRNVPVGGGCRKNRRSGKSVRFSTDHHGVSSKSNLACGGGSSINGHSYYCNKVVGSTSSPGGPNIDLALVYANFLNQQPADTKTGSATALEIPDFPGDHQFDPLVEFSNMSGLNLVEENGVVGGMSMGVDLSMEAHLSDSISDQQNYYSHEFDSIHKQQGEALLERLCTSRNHNQELPPLPNDEEILWLNNISDHHMTVNHTLQDQPMLGPDHQLLHDPNLLFGNWTTPFDFSTDDTFTKIT